MNKTKDLCLVLICENIKEIVYYETILENQNIDFFQKIVVYNHCDNNKVNKIQGWEIYETNLESLVDIYNFINNVINTKWVIYIDIGDVILDNLLLDIDNTIKKCDQTKTGYVFVSKQLDNSNFNYWEMRTQNNISKFVAWNLVAFNSIIKQLDNIELSNYSIALKLTQHGWIGEATTIKLETNDGLNTMPLEGVCTITIIIEKAIDISDIKTWIEENIKEKDVILYLPEQYYSFKNINNIGIYKRYNNITLYKSLPEYKDFNTDMILLLKNTNLGYYLDYNNKVTENYELYLVSLLKEAL